MSQMRDNIESLIKSGITAYKVAKDTGIPNNTVVRIFSGVTEIGKVRFEVIEKLNQYYLEECKMKRELLMKNTKTGEVIRMSEYNKMMKREFTSEKEKEEYIHSLLMGEREWIEENPYTEEEVEQTRKLYEKEFESGKTDIESFVAWFYSNYIIDQSTKRGR